MLICLQISCRLFVLVLVNTNFIWRFRVEKTLQVDEARNAAADVLNLKSKSPDIMSIEISLNDR
jgi:hypothetical protein